MADVFSCHEPIYTFSVLFFRFYITKWSRAESIRIAMGIGQDWNLLKEATNLVKSTKTASKDTVKKWLKENRAEIQEELKDSETDLDDIDEEELLEVFSDGK